MPDPNQGNWNSYQTTYLPVPPIGTASDAELDRVISSRIPYENRYWWDQCYNWRAAELMDQSQQWFSGIYNGNGANYLPWQCYPDQVDENDPNWLPRPVFNDGTPVRMNESSRLKRPEYGPDCRPNGPNPDALTRQACKKMTRALKSELYRMNWSTEDDLSFYRSPVHGNMVIKSFIDQRWDDTTKTPPTDALKCPAEGCDFTMAGPKISMEEYREGPGSNEFPEEVTEVELDSCPRCPDHPELEPMDVSMEEVAKEKKDSYGRPFIGEQPIPRWAMKCIHPSELFLPDLGIKARWDAINEWTHVHVESLDWVAVHFPEHAAKVQPEDPASLMKYHPVAGGPLLYSVSGMGQIFKNHTRVKEYYKKPWMEKDEKTGKYTLNKGRYIVIASGVKLIETDYYMDSVTNPGDKIERCIIEMPPWEFSDGGETAWGVSLWDMMMSPQWTKNEIMSMAAAVRERMALPFWWSAKDSKWSVVNRSTGVPGRLTESEWDPTGTGNAPRILGNETINDGVYKEVELSANQINNVGGRSDVEKGDVPGSVSAATAINILREESSEVRRMRIDRIKESRKRLYSHGARIIAGTWIEEHSFKYTEGKSEYWDKAKGMDFMGQTDVEIEAEPEFDSEDAKREAARESITLLGDRLGTPEGRMMARLIGAPAEITELDDQQEMECDLEWEAFVAEGRRPILDPSLDDPMTHYKYHGKRCADERFRMMAEAAGWDQALMILGENWDQDIQVAAYPMAQPVSIPLPTGETVQLPLAQAVQMGLAQAPPPMAMELRIEKAWTDKLMAYKFPFPDPEAMSAVLMWRSHMETCKLVGQAKAQAAAQGAALAAAPGAEQTQAGTQVAQNTPQSQIEQPMGAGAVQ